MDFMLNLVLTFTNNATSGLGSAANALSNLQGAANSASQGTTTALSALSYSADMLGNSFFGMGSKITGTLSSLVGSINNVGNTVYSAELGIGKLYSGADDELTILEEGSKKVDEIAQYAASTLFNFEDMIPIVQMLKANGIEAFDEIASSTGKANQTLMDYAADLAFFNPQMRNAYGTGIQAAMGALNEYIAEGNKRSLKAGASLDITGLLGEDVGSTIEERSRQVADLMEQLHIVGMTHDVGENNPMIMLSNLEDQLFIFKSYLAKSGIREEFVKIIKGIAEPIGDLMGDSEKVKRIASALGDAFVWLLKPVEKAAKAIGNFVKNLGNMIDKNPKMAKFVVLITALIGAALVGVGVFFKLVAVASRFGAVFQVASASGTSFFKVMTGGIGDLLRLLGPLALIMGAVYLAWRTDFMGMRSILTSVANGVSSAFGYASDALSKDVDYMTLKLNELDRDSFFGGLVTSIMKVMVIVESLADLWNDGAMDFDLYQKAVELGVDDLIGYIYDFKVRVEEFFKGFKEGWKETMKEVEGFIKGIGKALEGTPLEPFFDFLTGGLTNIFKMLSKGDLKDWKDMGAVFGNIAGKVLVAVVAVKGLMKVLGLIKKVKNIGGEGGLIGGLLGKGKGKDGGLGETTKGLKKTSSAMSEFVKFGAGLALVGYGIKEIADAVKVVKDSNGEAVLAGIGASLAGLFVLFAKKGDELKQNAAGIAVFAGAMIVLGYAMGMFAEAASKVDSGIGLASMIVMFVAIAGLAGEFSAIGKNLASAIPGMLAFAAALLIMGIAMEKFGNAVSIIAGEGGAGIGAFVVMMVSLAALAGIFSALGPALDVAAPGMLAFGAAILMAGEGVKLFSEGLDNIVDTIGRVINAVAEAASAIAEDLDLSAVLDKVVSVFTGIYNSIKEKIDAAANFVKTGIDKIKNAFNFSWSLPKIKLPHFTVTKGEGLLGLPKIGVDWYAKGGVVDQPTVLGAGEQGKEAIVPLEKNTEWITGVAKEFMKYLPVNGGEVSPVSVEPINADSSNTSAPARVVTNPAPAPSSTTDARSYDNSVTFSQGAIVIQANGSSPADAQKLGEQIMKYIARQQKIQRDVNYGMSFGV